MFKKFVGAIISRPQFAAASLFAGMILVTVPMTTAAQTPITTFGQLQTAIANAPADNSPTTILIGADFAVTAIVTIPANKNITIKGDAPERKLTRAVDVSGGSGLFVINGNGALTLENIIVDGDKADPPPPPPNMLGSLVRVQTNGTFTMNDGAVLRNNHAQSGGGVYVAKDGVFNMKGGKITGCSAQSGSAVYLR